MIATTKAGRKGRKKKSSDQYWS